MHLDIIRNRLMRYTVYLALVTIPLGCGALITGTFILKHSIHERIKFSIYIVCIYLNILAN